ncbi:MAG: sialidase family protein, partial [Candidatus Eisenbacteria bacterium]
MGARRRSLVAVALLLARGTIPVAGQSPVQVTHDSYLNYMPSLLQRADGGLLIVYERLDAAFENGDLMAVFSDDGLSWTPPGVVVAGPGNERHPSVVQRDDGSFLVFYLSDETGGYKIHHASSPDGTAWSALGAVDLGWTTESLVNPTVCREPDGSFTMAYDRLSTGGCVAHSEDGLAWDHLKTSVSTGSLNRIVRHRNGTYLLSYQRRTGLYYYQIDIFSKTSPDRASWSGENRVTTNQNSHDSFPLELADYRAYRLDLPEHLPLTGRHVGDDPARG